MARLTARARKNIPAKEFAGPDRSYPIEDASHARNALARASQHASPELQAKIKAKVKKRYPGISVGKMEGGKVAQRMDRPRRKK